MEFEKSRTWANLMSAFAGESQARTKYENYARKASEQGYEQIAAIFRATAANELAHASIWLEALHEGALPDTLVNLQDAAQGEHFEWSSMYKDYAEIAREEGYTRLAAAFELTARVEAEHDRASGTGLPFQACRKDCVDLPVLRAYPRRGSGSDALSALRQGPGLLRGA